MINNNEMSTNICYVTFTRANHKIVGQVSSTWISNILTNFICTSVMFLHHHLDNFWQFPKILPFWYFPVCGTWKCQMI
jgi:hypothetical protein